VNKEEVVKPEVKVTFLGTGTSQGVPVIACDCEVCLSTDSRDKRLRVSVLIEHKGRIIGVDAGPDFRQQMLAANVKRLDAILMTHEHKDHTAGLDDIRAFNFRSRKDMPVYAHPRVQESLRREFQYIFSNDPYPGIPKVELHTIDKQPFQVFDIQVTPIEVMHYQLPVLGFRIADFAYVTDAKTIAPEELSKLEGLDVLVINALRKETHISHLTLDEAIALVEQLQPKRAYFTHISHLMGLHKEVESILPHNIHIAYDGLEVEV
jgi:phosphoribosyl 1,2-cyclic phosphate phosphodiesterase